MGEQHPTLSVRSHYCIRKCEHTYDICAWSIVWVGLPGRGGGGITVVLLRPLSVGRHSVKKL